MSRRKKGEQEKNKRGKAGKGRKERDKGKDDNEE